MSAARTGRTVVTVLVATVLLVMAADYVAYAATGKSLVLGKTNNAAKTTTLSSKKGPALSLKSKPTAPSLAVSSAKLVKKLNADAVDGQSATQLAPKTSVVRIAEDNDEMDELEFYSFDLSKGQYLVVLDGYVVPAEGEDSSIIGCLMASRETLEDSIETPEDVDLSQVYTGDTMRYDAVTPANSDWDYLLSGSAVIAVDEPTEVVAGCQATEGVLAGNAPTFTFRRISGLANADVDDYELPLRGSVARLVP